MGGEIDTWRRVWNHRTPPLQADLCICTRVHSYAIHVLAMSSWPSAWDWTSEDQAEDGEYLDLPRVSCSIDIISVARLQKPKIPNGIYIYS